MEWNHLKCDPPVDPGEAGGLAQRQRRKHPDPAKLLNWYPPAAGKLPIEYARFVCQRANMRWDSSLRHELCSYYLIVLVALWTGGVIYALAAKLAMGDCILSVAVPLMPWSMRLVHEYRKHDETAKRSDRVKQDLQDIWIKAISQQRSPAERHADARTLQDELFDRRSHAPDIPDVLYYGKRSQMEAQMRLDAVSMVRDAMIKLGLWDKSSFTIDQLHTLAGLAKQQMAQNGNDYYAWRNSPELDDAGHFTHKVGPDNAVTAATITPQQAIETFRAKLDGVYGERCILAICSAIAAAKNGEEVALLQIHDQPGQPFKADGWLVLAIEGHQLFHFSPADLSLEKAHHAGLVTIVPKGSALERKFAWKNTNKVEELGMLLDWAL